LVEIIKALFQLLATRFMSGGQKEGRLWDKQDGSMLRCSVGRDIRLAGDAFSARKSTFRGIVSDVVITFGGSRVMYDDATFLARLLGLLGAGLDCVSVEGCSGRQNSGQ
jgi:hypothetical protein